MTLRGIHHATMVSGNAQRSMDFYTRIPGFRLVKQTINFDDPTAYRLYFETGTRTPSPRRYNVCSGSPHPLDGR